MGVKESGELFSKPEMLNDLNVMLNLTKKAR